MKSTLSKVLIFAAGAAIGSVVTWKVIKARYEQLMQAEIADIEARFDCLYGKDEDDDTDESDESEDEPEPDYDDVVKDLGYSNSEVKGEVKPKVISPEEFGELDGYELISLTYYSNGVLTDDNDVPVDDVEGTVGKDSLTTFGEHLDYVVHVRNDRLHAYYEIALDFGEYNGDIATEPPTEV